jgi:hypothetical protein
MNQCLSWTYSIKVSTESKLADLIICEYWCSRVTKIIIFGRQTHFPKWDFSLVHSLKLPLRHRLVMKLFGCLFLVDRLFKRTINYFHHFRLSNFLFKEFQFEILLFSNLTKYSIHLWCYSERIHLYDFESKVDFISTVVFLFLFFCKFFCIFLIFFQTSLWNPVKHQF